MITDELYRFGRETIVAQCSTYYPNMSLQGLRNPARTARMIFKPPFDIPLH
jgi:hypothetical protein